MNTHRQLPGHAVHDHQLRQRLGVHTAGRLWACLRACHAGRQRQLLKHGLATQQCRRHPPVARRPHQVQARCLIGGAQPTSACMHCPQSGLPRGPGLGPSCPTLATHPPPHLLPWDATWTARQPHTAALGAGQRRSGAPASSCPESQPATGSNSTPMTSLGVACGARPAGPGRLLALAMLSGRQRWAARQRTQRSCHRRREHSGRAAKQPRRPRGLALPRGSPGGGYSRCPAASHRPLTAARSRLPPQSESESARPNGLPEPLGWPSAWPIAFRSGWRASRGDESQKRAVMLVYIEWGC
jgi:hypothetical protein